MIEPGAWTESSGPRVLVENSDGAELWGYAAILREAGYSVATCAGPTGVDGRVTGPEDRARCPLIENGHCELVDAADIVVTACNVGQTGQLLKALTAAGKAGVFGVPEPMAERYADSLGGAHVLAYPVTEERLLDAVRDTLPASPQ